MGDMLIAYVSNTGNNLGKPKLSLSEVRQEKKLQENKSKLKGLKIYNL